MKQKLIYVVLLVACIYMPASSKECGKVCVVMEIEKKAPVVIEKPTTAAEELVSLPASPFSKVLFNL